MINETEERLLALLEETPAPMLTKVNVPGYDAPPAPDPAPDPVMESGSDPANDIPEAQFNAEEYRAAQEPLSNSAVKFQLKELIDPETGVMALDMLISWLSELSLEKFFNVYIDRADVAASEDQKKLLIRAITPAFEQIMIDTKNPLIAIGIGFAAVYTTNISDAIAKAKEAEAAGDTARKTKKKKAKFSDKAPESEPKKKRGRPSGSGSEKGNIIPLNRHAKQD